MSKFEWMELETLSNEITHAQSRLDAARSTKNYGLVQLLEEEIAEATERRARVLADITKGVAATGSARPRRGSVWLRKIEGQAPPDKQQPVQQVEALTATEPAEPTLSSDKMQGIATMWDQLKRGDIERFKQVLISRRSEMLARHAEELKVLEAEQAEIDTVERTIEAFVQKFKLTSGAEVLHQERSTET